MRIRGISPEFIKDLKDDKAPLNWIYKRVMSTNSVFSIEIRDKYINIYFRGGSLMKITENQPHDYTFKFDVKYGERKVGHERLEDGREIRNKNGKVILWCDFMYKHYNDIQNLNEQTAEEFFDSLVDMMDKWFTEHPKKEREYQHKLSLFHNNNNVLDIEYAIGNSGMRLDMILVDEKGDLYLIENKYGNDAIYSWMSDNTKKKKENPEAMNPGVAKHYKDFCKLLDNNKYKENVIQSMRCILKNKKDLGIIPREYNIAEKPEFSVVFVFANLKNSNRKKRKLETVLSELDYEKKIISEQYEKTSAKLVPYMLLTEDDEYVIELEKVDHFLDYDFTKVLH